METIVINSGPLTSYNSLVFYLGPKLKLIREAYLAGKTPGILLSLNHIEYGNINISALMGLLATCKKIRDYIGHPIPATIVWDPKLQGFLSDIGFFTICDQLRLFKWEPEGIIGGYTRGMTNPNTKMIFYRDIKPLRNINIEQIGIEKAALKQKIAPNFLMRCANLFTNMDNVIEDHVANTALELIVNSLMHAEEIAFVGLQRTSKRITISVCDGGIGFAKSLARTYPKTESMQGLSNIEGIVIGSLIQKHMHGLRLAISEVLNFNEEFPSMDSKNEGYVIISSFDTEIRWQKRNWAQAISFFDSFDPSIMKMDIKKIIGDPIESYIDKQQVINGYWKKYENFLVGTRITFEIEL